MILFLISLQSWGFGKSIVWPMPKDITGHGIPILTGFEWSIAERREFFFFFQFWWSRWWIVHALFYFLLHLLHLTNHCKHHSLGQRGRQGKELKYQPTNFPKHLTTLFMFEERFRSMWINLMLSLCMILKHPSSPGPHCYLDNQEFIWMMSIT